MAIECLADLPGVGENLIDHPEVPIVAMANGPYGYYRQGVGWRMLLNGLQFKLFGTGRDHDAPASRRAPSSTRRIPRPNRRSRRSACRSSISIAMRSGLVKDTYGLTVTTVVVKPKSRGFVRLRSANPDEMPLVSPHLLKDPADVRAMIDGQRFFLRAFQTGPLAGRIARDRASPIRAISATRPSTNHCRRFGEDQLSPERHLPDGAKPRSAGGAGFKIARPRRRAICACATSPRCRTSTRATPTRPAMMLGGRSG